MFKRKQKLSQMSGKNIMQAVGEKYSQVACEPGRKFNFPTGRKFAESVGYSKELLDNLPAGISESFTGAGNPQPFVNLQAGEILLDLGCGAGLDLYLYAQKSGANSKCYGLDISEGMLAKARHNLTQLGVSNLELLCSPADEILLADNFIDVVTSNGIYNLSPNKEAVLREAYRVLKPGGRTVFSEIVLKEALPDNIRENIDDWFRCIGGALPEGDFVSIMKKAGFSSVEIISKSRNARCGHQLAICANIRGYK